MPYVGGGGVVGRHLAGGMGFRSCACLLVAWLYACYVCVLAMCVIASVYACHVCVIACVFMLVTCV